MASSKICFRRLRTEFLEPRSLCAVDLGHNFLEPQDVNDDSRISPVDALLVIDSLNAKRGAVRHATDRTQLAFHDVNDDSRLSPVDALLVIDQLNSPTKTRTSQPDALAQVEGRIHMASTGTSASLEYEQTSIHKVLTIKLRNAPSNSSFDVAINGLVLGNLTTDFKGRGKLVFSQGDDNSSHLPLPSNLPPITAQTELVIGDVVRGRLSGLSANALLNNRNDSSSQAGNNQQIGSSNSSAWLATFPTVGSLKRGAEFETETEDGASKSQLKIEIEDAQAGQEFPITLGELSLGSVTANSRGKAKAIWSTSPRIGEKLFTNPVTVSEGTTIQIGQDRLHFQKVV
jgi:Dockerin type I domain